MIALAKIDAAEVLRIANLVRVHPQFTALPAALQPSVMTALLVLSFSRPPSPSAAGNPDNT